ncbi:MAG: phosphotransferase [Nitrospirae bacterium]|nr:phosphotransferase [Nitrospirota bacterium]
MLSKSAAPLSGLRLRAARLLAEAGCDSSAELSSIGVGGNNRIYYVNADPRHYVLKEYFRHPGDSRDRLGAEFAFAQFAWSNGIRCIPEPIAGDTAAGIGLYGHINGERILPGTLCRADIEQALEFIISLNRCKTLPEARALPICSEACFSISTHIDVVRGRLDRLTGIIPESPIDHELETFIQSRLIPAYKTVTERIMAQISEARISSDAELAAEERIISPSDFGFHNALRRQDGTIAFLDFEYAGWDDPAKLTGDFFNQVAVPVSLSYKDEVFNRVADILPNRKAALMRMHLLLPLYRIKWCCILLNDFLPVDSDRRDFAQGPAVERKKGQLDRAWSLLASLEELEI